MQKRNQVDGIRVNLKEKMERADQEMHAAMLAIEGILEQHGCNYLCTKDIPSIADFLLCSQCFEMI